MSGRAWKPGDVALLRRGASDWHRGMWVEDSDREGWVCIHGECEPDYALPLVVIDPEDREHVERIERAMAAECGWMSSETAVTGRVDALQAALRSLVTDPKPDEPMGLGAVVEDADGHRWVHSGGPQPAEGRIWYSPNLNGTALYADIAAVRVLSEGVS